MFTLLYFSKTLLKDFFLSLDLERRSEEFYFENVQRCCSREMGKTSYIKFCFFKVSNEKG
ncbi:hypothetical protein D6810_03005 [Candidatus Dojkabacteria bacterium]|uniref:Uncharacterized protein n=1 Tax=Candidatus Dojkabacteria bacterium TaxID=2099670 RepID=A0A3M0YYB8_9BACT|nr:MAG: hypothetical protein D6810_03005 [Candidatus Dojkabacteria bacterium]